MGKNEMKSVFLSYARPDGGFAKQVYDDLRRSGIDIWGFEADGRVGIDFVKQFTSQLQNRGAFCLLDSPHARDSDWVRKECDLALACRSQNPAFDFFPCLIQPIEREDLWHQNELFSGQNRLAYLDLTQYEMGIRKLCEHLGTTFFPYSDVQRDCDFRKEIQALGLDRKHLEKLEDLYKRYRKTRSDHPESACRWLNELIEQLDSLKADTVLSPRLALAVLYAKANQHKDAFNVFNQLSQRHPDDPRIWAGLAGALFFMGNYHRAMAAYRHSETLLRENGDADDLMHLVELVHNIARVHLELGNHPAAWAELKRLPDNTAQNPHIAELKGIICLERGAIVDAKNHFKAAHLLYRKNAVKPPVQLILKLADIYHRLGQKQHEEQCISTCLSELESDPEVLRNLADYFLRNSMFDQAVVRLTKAIEKAPDCIVCRSELASLFFYSGDIATAKIKAGECHGLQAKTARDHYYLGLAYYILEAPEIVKLEKQKAKHDSVVAGWPEYATLFSK